MRGLKRCAPDFGTVIDGGANVGQFARAAAETYPRAEVHSFEPLAAAISEFRRNLADKPQVHLHEVALGAKDGETTFFPNANSQSSSILPEAAGHGDRFIHDKQLTAIQVSVARLDTVFADGQLPRPLLLKLDLQGYELEALKGAPRLLQATDYILAETVFVRMYEGEPLFGEVMDWLRQAGFEFCEPLAFLSDAQGRIVQMDALFSRRGAPTAI
jgi:FkbM family methyltransferase